MTSDPDSECRAGVKSEAAAESVTNSAPTETTAIVATFNIRSIQQMKTPSYEQA